MEKQRLREMPRAVVDLVWNLTVCATDDVGDFGKTLVLSLHQHPRICAREEEGINRNLENPSNAMKRIVLNGILCCDKSKLGFQLRDLVDN
jgi:hypothetical protein